MRYIGSVVYFFFFIGVRPRTRGGWLNGELGRRNSNARKESNLLIGVARLAGSLPGDEALSCCGDGERNQTSRRFSASRGNTLARRSRGTGRPVLWWPHAPATGKRNRKKAYSVTVLDRDSRKECCPGSDEGPLADYVIGGWALLRGARDKPPLAPHGTVKTSSGQS